MEYAKGTSLKTLCKKRSIIRSQVTRLLSYLEKYPNMDILFLELWKNKLNELYVSFLEFQYCIESEDEASRMDYDNERNEFKFRYSVIADLINRRIQSLLSSRTVSTSLTRCADSLNSTILQLSNIFLLKFEIQPFDGNRVKWQSFYDTFKISVHDNDKLLAVQKFHLLKNSLSGNVAAVIEGLSPSEQNYNVAWNLLQKRCNKLRQIIQAHLNSLFHLMEVRHGSPINLRTLVEHAQMHVNALTALKQPTNYWDSFLVYLIVKKLDRNTRESWERSLEIEEMPKFNQLITFINKRARENESANEARRKRDETHRSVKSRNEYSLCNQTHEACMCAQFMLHQPRKRLNTTRGAKLCLNCLGNYSTTD